MSQRTPLKSRAVGIVVLVAAATACTGGDGSGSAPQDAAAAQLTVEQRAALSQSVKPSGSPQQQQQISVDYARQQTQFVAECMRGQGFVWSNNNVDVLIADLERTGPLSQEQFAAQYGFGVSTMIDAGVTTQRPGGPPTQDPRAGLSPEARQAYDQAYAACVQRMDTEVPRPAELLTASPEAEAALDVVARTVAADPRVLEAATTWSGCMAGQGFSYPNPAALHDDLEQRAAPFRQAYENRMKELTDDPVARNSLRVNDVLDPQQQANLASLQQFELSAAAADAICGPPYQQTYSSVYQETVNKVLNQGSSSGP